MIDFETTGRDSAPLKIFYMLVTFDVSHEERYPLKYVAL
jgi:hypothetical protein